MKPHKQTYDATTIRYQLTNHLDSASIELDENADIISYEEYHPFGTTSYRSGRSETEVSLKRYKYVFKELDNETGLYYYGMRYYAAWTARFVSVDPLQYKFPFYTPFQYSGNNPATFFDLDGNETTDNNLTNVGTNGQQAVLESAVSSPKGGAAKWWTADEWNHLMQPTLPKVLDVSVCPEIGFSFYEHAMNGEKVSFTFRHDGIKDGDRIGSPSEILEAMFKKDGGRTIYYSRALTRTNIFLNEGKNPITGGGRNRFAPGIESVIFGDGNKQLTSPKGSGHGYLNETWNHIFGQAALTVQFGADYAQWIGDMHERGGAGYAHMTTEIAENAKQVDFHKDLINNAWGRKLGQDFWKTHQDAKEWTPELTAEFVNYVNDYFFNSLDFVDRNLYQKTTFSPSDDEIKQFSKSLRYRLGPIRSFWD